MSFDYRRLLEEGAEDVNKILLTSGKAPTMTKEWLHSNLAWGADEFIGVPCESMREGFLRSLGDPQTATSLTSLMPAWMMAFPQLHRWSFSPAVNLLPPVCDLAPPVPCVAGAEVHRWGTCRNLRWESDDLPTLSNKATSIAHTHKASLVGNHSLSD